MLHAMSNARRQYAQYSKYQTKYKYNAIPEYTSSVQQTILTYHSRSKGFPSTFIPYCAALRMLAFQFARHVVASFRYVIVFPIFLVSFQRSRLFRLSLLVWLRRRWCSHCSSSSSLAPASIVAFSLYLHNHVDAFLR